MQRVDDSDSSIIYTPTAGWISGGVKEEWNSTTHGTRMAGAEMKFTFNGTRVDVYGTITANTSSRFISNLFILDNVNHKPVKWSATSSPQPSYYTKVFSAQALDGGMHTLVMKVTEEESE
ncbi:hypothetical protein L218DRAFT_844813, partial [Marasmius fiardii PR-910]